MREKNRRVLSEDALKTIYNEEMRGDRPAISSVGGNLQIPLSRAAALHEDMEKRDLVTFQNGRLRLTADGKIVTCLFSERGHDLKHLLRGGASDEEIRSWSIGLWARRADRYSEERLEAMNSPGGYRKEQRRKIEMISLGG